MVLGGVISGDTWWCLELGCLGELLPASGCVGQGCCQKSCSGQGTTPTSPARPHPTTHTLRVVPYKVFLASGAGSPDLGTEHLLGLSKRSA